jgi:hypothetical protein
MHDFEEVDLALVCGIERFRAGDELHFLFNEIVQPVCSPAICAAAARSGPPKAWRPRTCWTCTRSTGSRPASAGCHSTGRPGSRSTAAVPGPTPRASRPTPTHCSSRRASPETASCLDGGT